MSEQRKRLYKRLKKALNDHYFNGVDNHNLVEQYINDIKKLEKEEER